MYTINKMVAAVIELNYPCIRPSYFNALWFYRPQTGILADFKLVDTDNTRNCTFRIAGAVLCLLSYWPITDCYLQHFIYSWISRTFSFPTIYQFQYYQIPITQRIITNRSGYSSRVGNPPFRRLSFFINY